MVGLVDIFTLTVIIAAQHLHYSKSKTAIALAALPVLSGNRKFMIIDADGKVRSILLQCYST